MLRGTIRMNPLHGHIAVVTGTGSGVQRAMACALAILEGREPVPTKTVPTQ